MDRVTLDLWVGLFVLAGIAALLVLAVKVGNAHSFNVKDGYLVTAEFANIGGLKERAPVKSSGVVVGRVADITLDTDRYEARVTLELDPKFRFPKDTTAAILTTGLLGEQYIGLQAGADDRPLADGDTLKYTQSAVVLENLIGKFIYDRAAEGGDAPAGPATPPAKAAPAL